MVVPNYFMKFLIVGKNSEERDLNTRLQLLKNEGLMDFLRHHIFVQKKKIPKWYTKGSTWYDTMNKFPTVFDYYSHEECEIKKRVEERRNRGYYGKYIILGESAQKKNASAIAKFSSEYDDVRIVTENELKKLKAKEKKMKKQAPYIRLVADVENGDKITRYSQKFKNTKTLREWLLSLSNYRKSINKLNKAKG